MDEPKRLADPAFEPTDEDLIGLSKRAFAHVRDAHQESLHKMREDIAAASKSALERLHAVRPGLKAAR
jgi:predicted small metal-binding protein